MIELFEEEKIQEYLNLLKNIGSLSQLFSESQIPYLNYRITENVFCRVFDADNLSRQDSSIDARFNHIGIGIKTFINMKGLTYQKIAEFNHDSSLLQNKEPKELAIEVSRLRNERLNISKRIYNVEQMVYHCITRDVGKINICECPMDFIDLKKINHIRVSKSSIMFNDGKNEYLFNKSKNTLFKKFDTRTAMYSVHVDIIKDPYSKLKDLILENNRIVSEEEKPFVILPLYSEKGGLNVPERSGLNQWNAKGRKRDMNEVYIPIPSFIHKTFPKFFPDKDEPFTLILPDKKEISAKVCQDGGKALMSNPNKALGEWILRRVLNLKEGELLKYERLEEIGLDSVVLTKQKDKVYSINFLELGSYEHFVAKYHI